MNTLIIKSPYVNISMKVDALSAVNMIKAFEQEVPKGIFKRDLNLMKQAILKEACFKRLENREEEFVLSYDETLSRPDYELIYSDRAIPLVLTTRDCKPVLTVEKTQKWGSMVLLHPNGLMERVTPAMMQKVYKDSRAVHEGCFNPKAVQAYATEHGLALDLLAYEMIVGRWVNRCRKEEMATLEMATVY